MRKPVNTDNGHFLLSRVINSHLSSTLLYGTFSRCQIPERIKKTKILLNYQTSQINRDKGLGCSSSLLGVLSWDFGLIQGVLGKTPSYLAVKVSFRVAREKI